MALNWAILLLFIATALTCYAVAGLAPALSLTTNILFFTAIFCFVISLILIIIAKFSPKRD